MEAAAPTMPGNPAEPGVSMRAEFCGSGSEYFRIWVVNLLLTLATVGIYSAWAKVRREQYFHRATRLAGTSFDWDARPLSILRGRLLAVGLIVLLGWIPAVEGASISPLVRQRRVTDIVLTQFAGHQRQGDAGVFVVDGHVVSPCKGVIAWWWSPPARGAQQRPTVDVLASAVRVQLGVAKFHSVRMR